MLAVYIQPGHACSMHIFQNDSTIAQDAEFFQRIIMTTGNLIHEEVLSETKDFTFFSFSYLEKSIQMPHSSNVHMNKGFIVFVI